MRAIILDVAALMQMHCPVLEGSSNGMKDQFGHLLLLPFFY